MNAQDFNVHVSMVAIPSKLRKRPRFRGMPIPYTTWIHPETHVPDFKVNDEPKRLRVIRKRLCSLCGDRMNEKVVFIGGPGSVERGQLFLDAGMHPACARYAWDVCPYIVLGRGHAKFNKLAEDPRAVLVQFAAIPTDPPDRMGMLTTTTYEIVSFEGTIVVRAGPAESIEWRSYS